MEHVLEVRLEKPPGRDLSLIAQFEERLEIRQRTIRLSHGVCFLVDLSSPRTNPDISETKRQHVVGIAGVDDV